MKNLIYLALLFVLSSAAAQQQAMFTQYMFNMTAINPAVVGSHETLSLTALAREQWVGIEGAPNTQTLSLHSPLLNDQAGIGVTFLRDEIGITTQHFMALAYSYRINFRIGTLALGLQASASHYKSDQSMLNPNQVDLAINENYNSGLQPNFGTGAYFYTDRAYVGVSVPVMVNYNFLGSSDQGQERKELRRHIFFHSGYVFDLNRSLKLKPNVLVKAVAGAPINVDLNANLLIEEIVWVGVSYRSLSSVNAIFELQISPYLRFGYAHDFATTDLSRVSSGTHEFMINYRFKKKNKREISPRYF